MCKGGGGDDTAVAAKERKRAALQGLQRCTVAYVDAVISNASGVRQLRLDQSDGQARRVYKMGKVLMGRNATLKQHALARTHAQSIIGMVPPTAHMGHRAPGRHQIWLHMRGDANPLEQSRGLVEPCHKTMPRPATMARLSAASSPCLVTRGDFEVVQCGGFASPS